MTAIAQWGTDQQHLSDRVSVLMGADAGKYPAANSLIVRGDGETVIVDPSVSVVERGGAPLPVDAIINSHCHEDHMAGNGMFPDARVHVHHDDLAGVQDLDSLMSGYGLPPDAADDFRVDLIETFHYTPRPDATGFGDGHQFDLGGVTVTAVHLPGHTAGHSGFWVGDDIFYLSDIDLTGFGPYYGDAWSDLDSFEASIDKVRDVDAHWYVTSHHKGTIDGRERFIAMLDEFAAVIGRRHRAMLEYLVEPHTVDDMVAHRFIYRSHVMSAFANSVERRSALLHLARMIDRGEAVEVAPGCFQAQPAALR